VNWINNVVRPKIRSFLATKRDVPDNLWVKCPETGQMVFYKDLEANQFVIPGSNYHMRMGSQQRLASLFDDGVYDRVPVAAVAQDPLKFRDGRRYTDRLKDAKAATELEDAVLVAEGKLDGLEVVAAAQDFRFMAGSLGILLSVFGGAFANVPVDELRPAVDAAVAAVLRPPPPPKPSRRVTP